MPPTANSPSEAILYISIEQVLAAHAALIRAPVAGVAADSCTPEATKVLPAMAKPEKGIASIQE